MKVIGFRAGPKEIRYAILEYNGTDIVFLNNGENKLKYPVDATNPEIKIFWVYRELERIFEENCIDRIAIKINEYGTEKAGKRETTYVDATIMLIAAQRNLPVTRLLYSNLKLNSSTVQDAAAALVGKTEKYWDSAIADAIMAGVKVARG